MKDSDKDRSLSVMDLKDIKTIIASLLNHNSFILIRNFVKKHGNMNILAEKIEIMKLILETENPGILESVRNIFNKSAAVDFWETLPKEQQDDILQGIKEVENGDVVDYEEFMRKHK